MSLTSYRAAPPRVTRLLRSKMSFVMPDSGPVFAGGKIPFVSLVEPLLAFLTTAKGRFWGGLIFSALDCGLLIVFLRIRLKLRFADLAATYSPVP